MLLVVVFVVASACYQMIPADGMTGSLAQTAVLAAVAVVAVAASGAGALRWRGAGAAGWALRRWTAAVLTVALVGGMGAWAVAGAPAPAGGAGEVVPAACAVVAVCLLTGVYEEAAFRVLAMEAFEPALRREGEAAGRGNGGRATLRAAVASAVLFGLLHATPSLAAAAAAAGDAAAVAHAQLVLKALQAALFGFFMAAAYAHTRSLWPCALLHGAFDVLYLGPAMLATGQVQATYATGLAADLGLLALTTVLLAPPAVAAWRSLR